MRCRLIANLLLRMITVRLNRLPTVAATVKLHQAAPEENGRDSCSLEASLNLQQPAQEFSAYRAVAAFPLTRLLLFLAASFDGGHDVRVPAACHGALQRPTIMRCGLITPTSDAARATTCLARKAD